jgi:hypothetical protein
VHLLALVAALERGGRSLLEELLGVTIWRSKGELGDVARIRGRQAPSNFGWWMAKTMYRVPTSWQKS